MPVLFYPCRDNNELNKREWIPEEWTGRGMINPFYAQHMKLGGQIAKLRAGLFVCDSQAFQTLLCRISEEQALAEQLDFTRDYFPHQFNRFDRGNPFLPVRLDLPWLEALVTYDQLLGVDEALAVKMGAIVVVKDRGTRDTAQLAIAETLRAARYYYSQRHRLPGGCVIAYAAQGVDVDQYSDCVTELLTLARPCDWIAMGGFCIIGRNKRLYQKFCATCDRIFPDIARAGLKRVHILGVAWIQPLRYAARLAARYGLTISTDTSKAQNDGAIYGKQMCSDGTSRPLRDLNLPCEKWVDYHPHDLARFNVEELSRICYAL